MLGSIADRGQGSNAVAALTGPVFVPKRFVWPYGGRKVFLIGSFTRWSAVIPMSPTEGSPTVFQALCSLTPGYHQYLFNVDGQWRHDEQQPFVSGNYGTMNTLYVLKQPDILPTILRAETAGRSDMEVDNNVSGHVVNDFSYDYHYPHSVTPQNVASFSSGSIHVFMHTRVHL
ncbi:Immunoglobulin-like fold [Sesbania bispinosa]|nr:Immunoglobulin-like fold [Sesbania bispinosa]